MTHHLGIRGLVARNCVYLLLQTAHRYGQLALFGFCLGDLLTDGGPVAVLTGHHAPVPEDRSLKAVGGGRFFDLQPVHVQGLL